MTPNSSAADAFELPQRVAVLPDGNLLVADYALNDQEGGLVAVDRATGAARILRQGTLFNNPLGAGDRGEPPAVRGHHVRAAARRAAARR